MSSSALPNHTTRLTPKIIGNQPKKYSRSFSIHFANVVLGLVAVAGCVLLAIFIGTLLGRWIESVTKDQRTHPTLVMSAPHSRMIIASQTSSRTATIAPEYTHFMTATQTVNITRTVDFSAWPSTTLVTIGVPKPTAKCAGGGFSHPECQQG